MSLDSSPALSLSDVPELRRKTEAVSQFLQQQIVGHLETLRPLFAPERIFGKLAGGRAEIPGAELALAELQKRYRPFTVRPYDLPNEFDTNWLLLIGTSLDLYPWEYACEIQGKTITMTSPVRWVINYRTNYSFAQVKNVLSGKEKVRPEYLRQFVVNALVLQLALNHNPGLVQLFQDLGYDLKTDTPPELKNLPIVTITSCIRSFRPADEIITAATAFSGVPAFIELINLDAQQTAKDLLKEKLLSLMR